MSRGDKLLEATRGDPRDWRIADVGAVCAANGVGCTAPRNGSHYTIKHGDMASILTIPAHRPIKPVYIRELVALIDAVRGGTR